jgi:hypothetical protein
MVRVKVSHSHPGRGLVCRVVSVGLKCAVSIPQQHGDRIVKIVRGYQIQLPVAIEVAYSYRKRPGASSIRGGALESAVSVTKKNAYRPGVADELSHEPGMAIFVCDRKVQNPVTIEVPRCYGGSCWWVGWSTFAAKVPSGFPSKMETVPSL